ncbi:sugar ABC transporter ATP-binding protein [Flaviflexus salsibiostraticola]|uniref:Sugar ABC transporter ATP-binding protein n=1 Tax=Flaviflexus salsibiostraticola TaxID=1282737 RepID=A0A3Q8WU27_9ACTO|nr:sugar ABC transporter ATP-binding protein [Flaviflexus salsibiostraticola]AZN29244.1 sugar ABC transporter ATP-binding protein [Flaviflexus salsibiostraticola]
MTSVQHAQLLLSAEKLSKQYGSFFALRDVSLNLHAGEFVAVMGENGAGKSTLMKILAGMELATSGVVRVLADETLRVAKGRDLESAVAIVPQEIDLAEDRSIAQNIYMGNEPGHRWFPSARKLNVQAAELLARIGSPLDARQRVGDLDSASKQMVLIARALARESQIVIFDEPTANLSPRESESLFEVIQSLQSDGVGILYVSHRIPEVMRLSDRIEVLRDGSHSGSWPTSSTDEGQVVNSMVGRELDLLTRLEPYSQRGTSKLSIKDLRIDGIGPINLDVYEGQVVGIAGLPDSGREELLRGIYGAEGEVSGSIGVNGAEIVKADIREAVQAGVVYLPGERRAAGIFPTMSVKSNISSLVASRYTRFGLMRSSKLAAVAEEYAKAVNVRAASLDLPITSLSGGNQQKALIARLLATEPQVMLLDEPTRGVDVGAKSEVYSVISELTRKGMAVLLSSSDLPELLGQCHQILVMFRGEIVATLEASQTTEEEIMAYATMGHAIKETA